MAGSKACLAGPLGLEGGWPGGWTDGWTLDKNLPILQDFVPYWGCCPATAQLLPANRIKQGKGTADHMPLGSWLFVFSQRLNDFIQMINLLLCLYQIYS